MLNKQWQNKTREAGPFCECECLLCTSRAAARERRVKDTVGRLSKGSGPRQLVARTALAIRIVESHEFVVMRMSRLARSQPDNKPITSCARYTHTHKAAQFNSTQFNSTHTASSATRLEEGLTVLLHFLEEFDDDL
jgi:hypothetical protein